MKKLLMICNLILGITSLFLAIGFIINPDEIVEYFEIIITILMLGLSNLFIQKVLDYDSSELFEFKK